MQTDLDFWEGLDRLVAGRDIVIDRPRGSRHPRHPAFTYPLDYGYLAGTRAADGDGLDVWLGSRYDPERPAITAIVCTVDLAQQDVEIKLLLGCTRSEMDTIVQAHTRGAQRGVLVVR
jgi:inorganic pyrophosphatase